MVQSIKYSKWKFENFVFKFWYFPRSLQECKQLSKKRTDNAYVVEGGALISVQNHETECCSGLETLIIKTLVCTLQIHIQLDLLCFAKNCQAI